MVKSLLENYFDLSCKINYNEATINIFVTLLSAEIIKRTNGFFTVKRYWKGHIPGFGIWTIGLTGEETIQEVDVLNVKLFFVVEMKNGINNLS